MTGPRLSPRPFLLSLSTHVEGPGFRPALRCRSSPAAARAAEAIGGVGGKWSGIVDNFVIIVDNSVDNFNVIVDNCVDNPFECG